MTDMTQAPTPGPLTAEGWIKNTGKKPHNLPERFDVLFDDRALIENVTGCIWTITGQGDVAWWRPSLAPTAPVEASGSEREVVDRVRQMIVDCEADPEGPLMLSSSVAAEHASDLRFLLNLRPQPSGETRPTDEEIRSAIKATEYKYFGDYEFTDDQHAAVDVLVRAAQSVIRPAPVASGGQHSSGEDIKQALTLALELLGQMEPPDARAMSNEFVAMASALAGIQNQEGRDIISARLKMPFPSVPAEVTFTDVPADDKLRIAVEAWDELAKSPGLEISFNGFGEEDGWVVHRVTGGVNDREWEELACADTPLEALQEALTALKAEGK